MKLYFGAVTAPNRNITVLIQVTLKAKTKLITFFVRRFETQCLSNLIGPTICFCAILVACHSAHSTMPNHLVYRVLPNVRLMSISMTDNR
jgi:hypothetical protein